MWYSRYIYAGDHFEEIRREASALACRPFIVQSLIAGLRTGRELPVLMRCDHKTCQSGPEKLGGVGPIRVGSVTLTPNPKR